MPTRLRSGALAGIEGLEVTVETDISRGLPGFHLVGLPSAAVRESRQRVLAALRNCGVRVPPGRITVNLAPAAVPKEGAGFDLAIALGVVAAADLPGAGALRSREQETLFVGELSLFGEVRSVRGLLAIVLAAREAGVGTVVVPREQVAEAALVDGVVVRGAGTLGEVLAWLRGDAPLAATPSAGETAGVDDSDRLRALAGISALHGLHAVRKAAMVAGVGRHNLLLVGPPGTGKTRLARFLGDVQPALAGNEALEVTRIHSAAGLAGPSGRAASRPFRAPHHSVTRAGLLGGGAGLRPGEITLAHRGMLFLDEFGEFPPAVLDALREPLEEGMVTVVRGSGSRVYPALFQLVAAMNPCRCGFLGSPRRPCRCSPGDQRRYLGRLSGPLLDRFDIFVEVGDWQGGRTEAPPSALRGGGDWRRCPTLAAFDAARSALVEDGEVPHAADAARQVEAARVHLGLSLRGVERCLRVARTIAALDGDRCVESRHVREALEFRRELALPHWEAAGEG